MLFVPEAGSNFLQVPSYGITRPTTTTPFGTLLTPSTLDAYSDFVQIGTTLTRDSYGMLINANDVFVGSQFRQAAVQIGVDYNGGTTFNSILVSPLVVSQANNYAGGGGLWTYFPLFIPSGSSVGAASRASNANQFGLNIRYMTATPSPWAVKKASFVETLGVTLGAGTVTGVSVTPGLANDGAWTLIGTTTRRCWWWQISCMHSDITMTSNNYAVDLAYGNGTNFDTIILDAYVRTTPSETFENQPITINAEHVVPAGSDIYVRVQNAGTNENAGTFQVVVYGCGG